MHIYTIIDIAAEGDDVIEQTPSQDKVPPDYQATSQNSTGPSPLPVRSVYDEVRHVALPSQLIDGNTRVLAVRTQVWILHFTLYIILTKWKPMHLAKYSHNVLIYPKATARFING